MRLVHSEYEYSQQLDARVVGSLGDGLPYASCTAPGVVSNLYDMPLGGLPDLPIIVNLLNAIHLAGNPASFKSGCILDPRTN